MICLLCTHPNVLCTKNVAVVKIKGSQNKLNQIKFVEITSTSNCKTYLFSFFLRRILNTSQDFHLDLGIKSGQAKPGGHGTSNFWPWWLSIDAGPSLKFEPSIAPAILAQVSSRLFSLNHTMTRLAMKKGAKKVKKNRY